MSGRHRKGEVPSSAVLGLHGDALCFDAGGGRGCLGKDRRAGQGSGLDLRGPVRPPLLLLFLLAGVGRLQHAVHAVDSVGQGSVQAARAVEVGDNKRREKVAGAGVETGNERDGGVEVGHSRGRR